MCGEPRSKHALIQKRPEIKYQKQVFLNESKEQHWNLKWKEITPYVKGAFPPQHPTLYVKFLTVLKIELRERAKL